MSEKDFYTWVFGLLFIVFVATCSSTAGIKVMKEEAVANGAGQYNARTGEFEWIER